MSYITGDARMTTRRTLPLFLVLVLLLSASASAHDTDGPHDGHGAGTKWYRGNTHAHTVLCGHADSEPAAVAGWYLDRGYHFLCLSEHNQFIDPKDVPLPDGRRKDFILIPGEEITSQHVHMTGLNIDKLVGWLAQGSKSKVIQDFTDRTRDVAGVPIINHPNFNWALTAGDIRPVHRCHLFELYNGHPHVHNDGDATRPSTEAMWDDLLTGGMVIYGVSSDDAHEFKAMAPERSNPGRGWVMVRAKELKPTAIADAIDHGDFYASNGVFLSDVSVGDQEYRVKVDRDSTEAEVVKPEVMGKRVGPEGEPEPGYRIDFIGPAGKVVKGVDGDEAACGRDKNLAYLRAKVTFTRKLPDGTLIQHFAWTQPAFNDGRVEKLNR